MTRLHIGFFAALLLFYITVIDPKLNAILERVGVSRRSLVGALHAVQAEYRCLPPTALEEIARRLETTAEEIVSIASCYPQFRFQPAGRHRIKVCAGTACHVKGAETVWDALRDHLKIKDDDDTDGAGLFTVEKAACLGCCTLAPAVRIDDVTYGRLTARRVPLMLVDFRERLKAKDDTASRRRRIRPGKPLGRVSLCTCSSCAAAGADKVFSEIERTIGSLGINLTLVRASCSGVSYEAPLLEIEELSRGGGLKKTRYGRLTGDAAGAVIRKHFAPAAGPARLKERGRRFIERVLFDGERPVAEFLLDPSSPGDAADAHGRTRVVTEGAHEDDPLDLDAYRAAGGFEALARVRKTADKSVVITLIEESGLRGRGGAGFPTGAKWRAVFDQSRSPKYMIANGDEGDPGAFMDRMLMESFPFRVIEGAAVAAEVVGAGEVIVYVRTEYPLALERLRRAIEICRSAGVLGALLLTVVEGGGAFICGEETALIASIEGRRPVPRPRPPYPAERGLDGCPTLVNNVETLAAVPWIVRRGAAAYAALGRMDAGTKTFALAGKIARGGLVEVPLGLTLREIVFDLGGGVQDGRTLKAVQIGGPSGGLVPASLIDLPVDYESLREHGSMMGSGGLVVLDDTDCIVEVARYFTAFTASESCGACAPCRVGLRRLSEMLARFTGGTAVSADLVELERLARSVQAESRCGLGRTAPNPVLTALEFFREEFEAHVAGRCPALMCAPLVEYCITDKCVGCTRCAQACPADAIAFTPYERHTIDSAACTRCDACRQVCPSGAVEKRQRHSSKCHGEPVEPCTTNAVHPSTGSG